MKEEKKYPKSDHKKRMRVGVRMNKGSRAVTQFSDVQDYGRN